MKLNEPTLGSVIETMIGIVGSGDARRVECEHDESKLTVYAVKDSLIRVDVVKKK